MTYGVAEVARFLRIDTQRVKALSFQFSKHLSIGANPQTGKVRKFCENDVLVLLYVMYHWDDDSDITAIEVGIDSNEHLETVFVHELWNYTPLLQDGLPEYPDEPSRHGLLVSPRIYLSQIEIARSYVSAANTLWDKANEGGFPAIECYPVLFAYRHALELYLKLLSRTSDRTHSLDRCLRLLEKYHEKKIPPRIRDWILTLHRMDETGCSFRYEAAETEGSMSEEWLDWGHLRYAMDRLFDALDYASINMDQTTTLG